MIACIAKPPTNIFNIILKSKDIFCPQGTNGNVPISLAVPVHLAKYLPAGQTVCPVFTSHVHWID
jgi:hypothetical protein